MNLSELLTNPKGFFEELKEQQPNSSRYIWLVLASGLVGAIAIYVSQMNMGISDMPGMPAFLASPIFKILSALLSSLFLAFLLWLVMWGLGMAGAGKEGRAAEVYGASFIASLVINILLIPLYLLMPIQINITPPDFSNLNGAELSTAIQTYQTQIQTELSQQPASIIGNILSVLTFIWQFFVAWIGFNVITGDRTKAFKGVLFPAILFTILGVGSWLMGQMTMGMGS